MSKEMLTKTELKYISCTTPTLSGTRAAMRIVTGVFASMGQALISPSSDYGKADQGLIYTLKLIRYTKYKKAVQNKLDGKLSKKDLRALKKINSKDFILDDDSYDPDKFTKEIYDEYMKSHKEK